MRSVALTGLLVRLKYNAFEFSNVCRGVTIFFSGGYSGVVKRETLSSLVFYYSVPDAIDRDRT